MGMRTRIEYCVMGSAHQKVHVCHESCAKLNTKEIIRDFHLEDLPELFERDIDVPLFIMN